MLNIYKNKNILITGNTGFVGGNLTLFLLKLGANVIGYSDALFPHFDKLNLVHKINQYYGNVKNYEKIKEVIQKNNIDLIIHCAAQAIVIESYVNPKETYEVNALGTLNILEAMRELKNVPALINVTSDKCYKNVEKIWGYTEEDELNGYDPYSNSKSVSELITESYRNSFFNLDEYKKSHNTLIATVRAGNIIGMGDFGKYRIISDLMRARNIGEVIEIRYPKAIRPWTFVLDTCLGYLMLGERLLEGDKEFADAWNFSSELENMISVETMILKMNYYHKIDYAIKEEKKEKETTTLRLDSTKAKLLLGWRPVYDIDKTIETTINWYEEWYKCNIITEKIVDDYINELKENI